MNKKKLNTKANADKKFGDYYFDISENSKRLERDTLETFDQAGTYVFLKIS